MAIFNSYVKLPEGISSYYTSMKRLKRYFAVHGSTSFDPSPMIRPSQRVMRRPIQGVQAIGKRHSPGRKNNLSSMDFAWLRRVQSYILRIGSIHFYTKHGDRIIQVKNVFKYEFCNQQNWGLSQSSIKRTHEDTHTTSKNVHIYIYILVVSADGSGLNMIKQASSLHVHKFYFSMSRIVLPLILVASKFRFWGSMTCQEITSWIPSKIPQTLTDIDSYGSCGS